MIYHAQKGQVFYGHTVGVLMLDSFVPLIPGDVGNATTYTYPVLYRTLKGITAQKLVTQNEDVLQEMISKGKELVKDGAKAITGDCGFMLFYQHELRKALQVPVFLSSLLQLPFMLHMVTKDEKVGIITADSTLLDETLLNMIEVHPERVVVSGLEDSTHFYQTCLSESGTLDSTKIEKEVVSAAEKIIKENQKVKAILLECSFLPPYAKAVQHATNIPIFDFVSMIDYVHSSFAKRCYGGYL
ncbi:hypothetical protein JCM9140_2017 [Halalkalibacter wakoensis JCM 9140]|uniref:Aspartate/glutamate racemase family protein n=1 Tax=Halalkalibacter wakoensis JCM 9140 TaxID=1236970 RepID=W4Q226_9BACI|nr:aspartate/glutamate racemase family protein [Halalkalibacter wakoensis]GAE25990.1 hypothetical protein JCM9140_2017 [Halalkalibacter wakoensis JCM 9140]